MDPLASIRRAVKAAGADAVLVTSLPHIRWATGFTGSSALLVVTPTEVHLFTDGRYRVQAAAEVERAQVHVSEDGPLRHLAGASLMDGITSCLIQSEHLSVAQANQLEELIPSVVFLAKREFLVEPVAAKSDVEVERIRRAQDITDAVFTDLLALIEPGVAELDLAAEIVYRHLRHGCERMAFEPIVASGPRAALPHARPTRRKIRMGDMLLIDMGGVREGYASDMTRTVAVGEPSDEARRAYGTVLDAQEAAVASARAGMTGRELDAVARDVIEAAGYGDAFPHSLGHGIGLETHEWPSVSRRNDKPLPADVVVTIEPGIYLPGSLGVRIEDIVVLRGDGCENLTTSTKELLIL